MIKVYVDPFEYKDASLGASHRLVFCEKEYYDRAKDIGDANSKHYKEILDAFLSIGLSCYDNNMLLWTTDKTVEDISNEMKELGFELIVEDNIGFEDGDTATY